MDGSNVIFDVAEMQQEAEAVWYFKSQFWLILSSDVHLRRKMGLKGRVVSVMTSSGASLQWGLYC